MDVSIRVPAGMKAISVGRLESADSGNEKNFDTWHWIARQPMATYLNFMAIGHYELKQGIDHGLPYVYAVSEKLTARTTEDGLRCAADHRSTDSHARENVRPLPLHRAGRHCAGASAVVRRAGDPDPAGL